MYCLHVSANAQSLIRKFATSASAGQIHAGRFPCTQLLAWSVCTASDTVSTRLLRISRRAYLRCKGYQMLGGMRSGDLSDHFTFKHTAELCIALPVAKAMVEPWRLPSICC